MAVTIQREKPALSKTFFLMFMQQIFDRNICQGPLYTFKKTNNFSAVT